MAIVPQKRNAKHSGQRIAQSQPGLQEHRGKRNSVFADSEQLVLQI